MEGVRDGRVRRGGRARCSTPRPASAPASTGTTPPEPWSPLTRREFEVARLVARGLTNREIAEELRITARTAGSHLEHIRAKLGVSRRSEIAAWATAIEAAESSPQV